MNHTYRIIPVYTGDVSGVASALYELGGMVVIHDPSGCNSTYNTHDETRWYDKESLIFISGLAERDAVLGNDKKLIADVTEAALELHPAFIALTNSPIPFMNGTDFHAIAKIIEERTGIPTFYVPANGMHDYTSGAGAAFAALAEFMDKSCGAATDTTTCGKKESAVRINLLGVTPLDFDAAGAVDKMEEMLSEQGFEIVTDLGMGTHAQNWRSAAQAQVNLIVSATGLPLAKELHKRYQIPYVVGTPTGAFAEILVEALQKAAQTGANVDAFQMAFARADAAEKPQNRVLIGEAVTMRSVAAAIALEKGELWRVICPLENGAELLSRTDAYTKGEEDLEELLTRLAKDPLTVVADPLYEPILPQDTRFVPLSHEAFSGRCLAKQRLCTVGAPADAVEYIKKMVW